MATGIINDHQNLEKHIKKQMGCMAGFFQLFDRNQILTGKRITAAKRLPPASAVGTTAEAEVSFGAISRESDKPQQTRAMTSPSPDRLKSSPVTDRRSPTDITATLPLHLPILESKEGTTRPSWKFCKEAPRLSLDSRATVDTKGSRSPSVIGRLMGLEPLPNSSPEQTKNAELRRSASESRVSRDFHYRCVDGNNFQLKQHNQFHSVIRDNAARENTSAAATLIGRHADLMNSEPAKPSFSPRKSNQLRKSFFDSADFFPEPKQTVSIYGEIEKRLRMRGINEPSKDLETLKQILEAMQLKGLLHSKKTSEQISHRNFVYERSFSPDDSPIVIMKPSRSPASPINRRFGNGNESPPASFRSGAGFRRNVSNSGESLPSFSPRRERHAIESRSRNSSSPTRRESNAKNPNSPARRQVVSAETQRKTNESPERRRAPPVHSPRLSPKRNGSDQTITTRPPRNRKSTAEIQRNEKIVPVVIEDESSSISGSSVSTSSQADTERLKMEEYRGGRGLLERCDKLLHSIMEMTANELQPSPVSVLDSSFYKDESSSPSPVMKRRSIDLKDLRGEFEEEIWSPAISPLGSKHDDESDDCDFVYISDVLRASTYLPEDSDKFLLLEKQQYLRGKDTSKVCSLQRKLIFDTITEILDRNRQLPPWKVVSWSNSSVSRPSLSQIWSEFRRIRERDTAEDLFEIIRGVLRKDLAGDAVNGWGDCPVEMSESVLDIERLIYKDLVGETIQDLAALAVKSRAPAPPRRKLVF